jgi:hypothetical protein
MMVMASRWKRDALRLGTYSTATRYLSTCIELVTNYILQCTSPLALSTATGLPPTLHWVVFRLWLSRRTTSSWLLLMSRVVSVCSRLEGRCTYMLGGLWIL